MIKSVLHLLKIHGKVIFGNSSVIVQDMLRKTPKSLNAVNVIFGSLVDHVFGMINLVMLAPALERIVTSEFIRKVDGALPCLLAYNLHQLLGRNTLDHSRVDPPVSLQKAENDAFASSSAPTLSFASAAKVALIHLNLAGELASLQFCHMIDRFTKALVYSRNRLVIKAEIVREFVGRLSLVESLQNIQLSFQLLQGFLFYTGTLSASDIPSLRSIGFERTAKNTLFTPQKVGRAPENVLLTSNHKDILAPRGYVSH